MPTSADSAGPAAPGTTRLLRAGGLVAVSTLLSRLLGLARDTGMSALFGAGPEYGAFNLAWMLPNLFRRIFGEGALSTAFVPAFVRTVEKEGKEKGRRLAGAVAGALLVVLGSLTLAGVALALGFPDAWLGRWVGGEATARLLRRLSAILFPYVLFICLYAVAAGALNSLGRFFVPALAPAALNLVWLGGVAAVAVASPATLEEAAAILAWVVLGGGVLQLGMQLPALRSLGVLPRPKWDPADPGLRSVVRTMAPMVLGVALFQVNTFVDQAMAWGFVSPGANNYVYLANRLLQFPVSLVGFAAATAAFPAFARLAANEDRRALRGAFDRTLGFVLFLALPAGAGLLALASPCVSALFEHGRFEAADRVETARAVAMYALGVPFLCAIQILARVHYALGDARTPVRISGALVFANAGLNLLLVRPLGVSGLALATTVTAALNAALLARRLDRAGLPRSRELRARAVRSIAAALACGALAFGASRAAESAGTALSLAAGVVAGIAGFLGIARALGCPELLEVGRALGRAPRRPGGEGGVVDRPS